MRMSILAYCACVLTLGIVGGCGKDVPANVPSVPANAHAGPETYLKTGVASVNPGDFSEVTNPAAGVTMLVPSGFEWESPETYFAALNTANPQVLGGGAVREQSPIIVFDAQVDRLRICLKPARIEVERIPPFSVEDAERQTLHGDKDWVPKGRLDTPLGPVPTYERSLQLKDALGVPVTVVQRRYFMCWEGAGFVVFTYCPTAMEGDLTGPLQMAALTVRPIPVDRSAAMVFPPASQKNARFGTNADWWREEERRARDQATLDTVNEINRENAQRRRLQEEQEGKTAGDVPNQGTPPQSGDGDKSGSGTDGGTTGQ